MPISHFEYSGPPVDETDLALLERQLGVALPAPYRAFLLRINGGRPTPEEAFDFRRGIEEGSLMAFFYTVNDNEVDDTIEQIRRGLQGRVPDDLLAIGSDLGGSQICIGIGADNYGKVYFWSMDDERDVPIGRKPGYYNVRQIAEDFDEFIDGFYDYEAKQRAP